MRSLWLSNSYTAELKNCSKNQVINYKKKKSKPREEKGQLVYDSLPINMVGTIELDPSGLQGFKGAQIQHLHLPHLQDSFSAARALLWFPFPKPPASGSQPSQTRACCGKNSEGALITTDQRSWLVLSGHTLTLGSHCLHWPPPTRTRRHMALIAKPAEGTPMRTLYSHQHLITLPKIWIYLLVVLSLSCSMWTEFPDRGFKPRQPALGARVLATGPSGKSQHPYHFDISEANTLTPSDLERKLINFCANSKEKKESMCLTQIY